MMKVSDGHGQKYPCIIQGLEQTRVTYKEEEKSQIECLLFDVQVYPEQVPGLPVQLSVISLVVGWVPQTISTGIPSHHLQGILEISPFSATLLSLYQPGGPQ